MREVQALETKLLAIMNRLNFFRNFTLQEKQQIIDKQGTIMATDLDEEIIVQDRHDASFYLLLSGSLEVVLKKSNEHISLAKIRPNDFVGEMSFLTGEPRSTSVYAREESLVLKVDKLIMNSLKIEIREKIKDQIIDKLVTRLKEANEKLTKKG